MKKKNAMLIAFCSVIGFFGLSASLLMGDIILYPIDKGNEVNISNAPSSTFGESLSQMNINNASGSLTLSPYMQNVAVGVIPTTITANGGATYTYALNAGTTGITKASSCTNGTNNTCALTAPTAAGTAKLDVTAGNATITATITVEPDPSGGSFTVSPMNQTIQVGTVPTTITANGGTSYINGTYLVLNSEWKHYSLTKDEWRKEFVSMRDIGINTIIIQNVVTEYNDGSLRAAYPSKFISLKETNTQQLEDILALAKEEGFQVFIGLIHKKNPFELNKKSVWDWTWDWWWQHKNITQELIDLYGKNPSFVGFYITQEPTINYTGNPNNNQAVQFFAELSRRLRDAYPDKLLAVAPTYVAKNGACKTFDNIDTIIKTPSEFQSLLANFLKKTSFDRIYLQDKLGTDLVSFQELPLYFDKAKEASKTSGVMFASTIETFEYCNSCTNFCPAPFDRIKKQLEYEAPYVNDFIAYSWFEDLSPSRGVAQKKLYDAYKNYRFVIGKANYTYTLVPGTTGITKASSCTNGTNNTCALTAPTAAGTAKLDVTAGNATITATITVEPDPSGGSFTVSPMNQTIQVGTVPTTITANGGATYTYALNAGTTGITKASSCTNGTNNTCALTAPTAAGTAKLDVTAGNATITATITVQIGNPIDPPPLPNPNCALINQVVNNLSNKSATVLDIFGDNRVLLNVFHCANNEANFTVGKNDEKYYIWKQLYYSKNGLNWNSSPTTLSGNNTSGDWIVGEGSATVSLTTTELQNKNYAAIYICVQVGSEWKCGCSDTTCTGNSAGKWSLQSFKSTRAVSRPG